MARTQYIVLFALLTSACSGSPTSPTSAPVVPLALSGQSNAEFVVPSLRAAYGPVVGAWESGLGIAFWSPDDRLWRALEPTLHQPVRAFVWWQGESDYRDPSGYAAALADLMIRVRAAANAPTLPIILVRIAPDPSFAIVRVAEAAWVAQDAHAVLVNTDDLPLRPGEVHLTDEGYRLAAARIVAALP